MTRNTVACPTCGTTNTSTAMHCSHCGTDLTRTLQDAAHIHRVEDASEVSAVPESGSDKNSGSSRKKSSSFFSTECRPFFQNPIFLFGVLLLLFVGRKVMDMSEHRRKQATRPSKQIVQQETKPPLFAPNHTKYMETLFTEALRGSARAQTKLGVEYLLGKRIPKNSSEAAKWFRKAAEQGLGKGQCLLGICYQEGYGLEKQPSEAVKWYRKAAKQGSAWGQYLLGTVFFSGTGVSRDLKEAHKWFELSADQGDRKAEFRLGWMYHQGVGVPEDREEAIKWYKKAAAQGHQKAAESLKLMGVTQE